MGAVGTLVGGALVTRPGVYPEVDVSAMTPVLPGFAGLVLAMGASDGGDPGVIYTFRSPDEAASVIKGGRILSYISRMFAPSPDRPGASVVKFIRANQTVSRASVIVEDAETPQFTILARDFGAWTNGIRASIVRDVNGDATLPTAWAAEVPTPFSPWTVAVEYPAAKQKFSFRLRCGILLESAGATLTVTHATRLVTLAVGATTEVIDFDRVPTLKDLASWINSHAGAKATVVGSSWYPVTVLNDASISPAGAGHPLFLPAESGLAVYLLNTQCPLVQAEFVEDAVPDAIAVALPVTYLSGGAGRGSDALEATGVARALGLAETTQAHLVFLQSADSALQQLALTHCAEMCDIARRRFRVLVTGINYAGSSPVDGGTANGATVDAAVEAACERARSLDGPAVCAFRGTLAPNSVTGVAEQLGGLGLAAQVIGLAAGSYVSMPLTNKPVISQGLEFPNLKDSHFEALLDAGVLVVRYDTEIGRTVIEQAITCYQTTNSSFRNLQGLRIQHEIERMWMRVLALFVGAELDLATGEQIKAECAKALDHSIRSGSNPSGFLTEGKKNGERIPAWDSLRVVGDSTVGAWEISCNAHAVGETDIIKVRTKLTPAPIEL